VHDGSFEIVSVRPNPVSHTTELYVLLPENGSCNIIVSGVDGSIVFRQDNVEGLQGLNIFKLDISHLSNGIYFISLQSDFGQAIQRIAVLR